MQGITCAIIGSNKEQKTLFENSIAKKNEVEGIIVYHRAESGIRYSFLDDTLFPEKIQGYSRIASISDYAFFIYPGSGKLTSPDGELAILLNSFRLDGRVVSLDTPLSRETVSASFKGINVGNYPVEIRDSKSSIIELPKENPSPNFQQPGTIIYVDRAFNVKGVGVVVLGFVLSGKVSLHDKLRLIPSTGSTKYAEVKGIQISDEDYTESERGIRIGLSLKGVEIKDLAKTSWLDDGSFQLSFKLNFQFFQSPYYKQIVSDRDMHVQLPGELAVTSVSKDEKKSGLLNLSLQHEVPVWQGMKVSLIDLNGKNLRVAGGGTVSLDGS
jgi:selenocysteine-specific translation elongation factor